MRPWQLGNTSVRSPFRLRDGLIALSQSSLQGDLHGAAQEEAFRSLLGAHGVVSLGTDATNSVSRKWRSALAKMGFITPDLSKVKGTDQVWIGAKDCISDNGKRLIESESVAAWQECFLRALAAYFIPSVLEPDYEDDYKPFSPLRHVLNILLALEKETGESRLNFIEMALVVQFTSSDTPIKDVLGKILSLRMAREKAKNKRPFDTERYDAAAKEHKYKTGHTFKDYADLNFRYLKSTGLFLSKGKGIVLSPEKHLLVSELVKDMAAPLSPQEYLVTMCKGATLPTDKKEPALLVLNDLVSQLKDRGETFELKGRNLNTPQEIAVIRHDAEERISHLNEVEFAKRQKDEWEEIAGFLKLFATNKFSTTLENGNIIEIPKGEAPAYLEWTMW